MAVSTTRGFCVEQQYLQNIKQFQLTTSSLSRLIEIFKNSKDVFDSGKFLEIKGLLDSVFDTHATSLNAACADLQTLIASEGSTDITEEFNNKSASLLQCVKSLTNFIYKSYQILIDNKTESQVELFDWLVVDDVQMDNVPELLRFIAHDISSIPANLDVIIDDLVNFNSYELNNALCDCDVLPFSVALGFLSLSFAEKCTFSTPETSSATKQELETATSELASFHFEHKVCVAEYVDSLARVESITSAINSQLYKLACKDLASTLPYSEANFANVCNSINKMKSVVDAIGQSVQNIAALSNGCVMNRQFIAETRNIQAQLRNCFNEVELLYSQLWGSGSSTEITFSSVHHEVNGIPNILNQIESNLSEMLGSVSQIFNAFSSGGSTYEQHIGEALTSLKSSVLSLGERCAGSTE
ncbi:MAG: hypothetical protein LBJ89_03435, partial [Holosporales bacterium]|nr:hypothetical protein [Holosporales bacterium]